MVHVIIRIKARAESLISARYYYQPLNTTSSGTQSDVGEVGAAGREREETEERTFFPYLIFPFLSLPNVALGPRGC
jgi:hypothetical protein